jgi:hypothetical protein
MRVVALHVLTEHSVLAASASENISLPGRIGRFMINKSRTWNYCDATSAGRQAVWLSPGLASRPPNKNKKGLASRHQQ